jgi:hypothetical protein
LTIVGRQHLVSAADGAGGFTNFFEPGALAAPGVGKTTGALVSCIGQADQWPDPNARRSENLLFTNCAFKDADIALSFAALITNVFITKCDFIEYTGTNDYPGERNPATSNTSDYPLINVGIFAHSGGTYNFILVSNTFNGNVKLTTPTTSLDYVTNLSAYEPLVTNWTSTIPANYAADGLVICEEGGNWFIARNSISNNHDEGIFVKAGPSAIVANQFTNLINVVQTCAVSAIGDTTDGGASSPPRFLSLADNFTSMVGNDIRGERTGHNGSQANEPRGPARANISGNLMELSHAFDVTNDWPGGASIALQFDLLSICGNTLLSGDDGVRAVGSSTNWITNCIILKNDFAGVRHRGMTFDSPPGLTGKVQVVRNVLGCGEGPHVRVPYDDSFRWFLNQNRYRNAANTFNSSLSTDPAASSVNTQ